MTKGICVSVAGHHIRVLVTGYGMTPVLKDVQSIIGATSRYLFYETYQTAYGCLEASPIYSLKMAYLQDPDAMALLGALEATVEQSTDYHTLLSAIPKQSVPLPPVAAPPTSVLEPIHTDEFNGITVLSYGTPDDPIWTRLQVGKMLEYAHPQKAMDNIHTRHADRLDKFSVTLNLRAADKKVYKTVGYTFKGVLEACRFSKQPVADAVVDYTWHIMDEIRRNGSYSVLPMAPTFNVSPKSRIRLRFFQGGCPWTPLASNFFSKSHRNRQGRMCFSYCSR